MDDINITYPNVGTLYSSDGNGMQVNWNYQSQSNDMQSLSWAYKLDEDFYGTGTSATQVDGNDSVEGTSWLSSISADGQTHTLYVALLDGSGNRLADEQYSFTYNTGSKYKSQSTLMVNQESWNTGIPGASSGTWYQSFKANFDSKLHKFAFVTNGVFNASATVTVREGVGTDGTILHTGTWTGIGTNTNDYNEYTPDEDVMLTLDQNYTIQLQNQTSGGFLGHDSNQYDDGIFYYSGYSGEYGDLKMKIWAYEENPIPDSISI
ncbi:hypothetical protein OAN13_06855, partial [Opitutales bacterium]|nr:hypothetical protein [Opitutales bacterium]